MFSGSKAQGANVYNKKQCFMDTSFGLSAQSSAKPQLGEGVVLN